MEPLPSLTWAFLNSGVHEHTPTSPLTLSPPQMTRPPPVVSLPSLSLNRHRCWISKGARGPNAPAPGWLSQFVDMMDVLWPRLLFPAACGAESGFRAVFLLTRFDKCQFLMLQAECFGRFYHQIIITNTQHPRRLIPSCSPLVWTVALQKNTQVPQNTHSLMHQWSLPQIRGHTELWSEGSPQGVLKCNNLLKMCNNMHEHF